MPTPQASFFPPITQKFKKVADENEPGKSIPVLEFVAAIEPFLEFFGILGTVFLIAKADLDGHIGVVRNNVTDETLKKQLTNKFQNDYFVLPQNNFLRTLKILILY